MITRTIALMIAVHFGVPLAANAQQPRAPTNPMEHATMMCPMQGQAAEQRGDPATTSQMMSRMKVELGLTDVQAQEMHATHQRACAAAEPHLRMAMEAQQAAMRVLEGDSPDFDEYEDQLEKAAKHMVEAQVAIARGMVEMRRGLTLEQRQKMERMHQEMHQGVRKPGTTPGH